MVDACRKGDFRRLEGVVSREVNGEKVHSTGVRRIRLITPQRETQHQSEKRVIKFVSLSVQGSKQIKQLDRRIQVQLEQKSITYRPHNSGLPMKHVITSLLKTYAQQTA